MLTRQLTRVSAVPLGAAGLVLILAADDLVPRLAAGTPTSAAWVAQVLGAALLALLRAGYGPTAKKTAEVSPHFTRRACS